MQIIYLHNPAPLGLASLLQNLANTRTTPGLYAACMTHDGAIPPVAASPGPQCEGLYYGSHDTSLPFPPAGSVQFKVDGGRPEHLKRLVMMALESVVASSKAEVR